MKALCPTLAYVACVTGFAWLALSMEPHWQHVRRAVLPEPGTLILLRALGGGGLAVSLALCLVADHASVAALVWVMTLTAGALTVAFTLSWRPALLAPLVAWVRDGAEGPAR